jgi:predicted kinase
MKPLVLMVLTLLCACASESYSLGHGVADYDALKLATDKCQADGGRVVLDQGYDNRDLSSYRCQIGGGK